jgi:DNA-directed RNA polymerase subunit RPC12/RpoP
MSFCGNCDGCTFRLPRNVGKNCKHGSNCRREDCYYAHASPAGRQRMAGDERAACTQGIRCTRGNCAFAHPSPSLKCSNYHGYSDRSDSDAEYECNECGRTFGDWRALEQHQEDKGHENWSDEYECEQCGKTFRDGRALEQHQEAKGHGNRSKHQAARNPSNHRSQMGRLPSPPHSYSYSSYPCYTPATSSTSVAQLADSRVLPPAPSSTSVAQSSSNCPEGVSSLHSLLSFTSELLNSQRCAVSNYAFSSCHLSDREHDCSRGE